MDIRKKYTEETGRLCSKESALEFEWDDDYVEWLEQNLVKLFAIPDVSQQREQFVSFARFAHNYGKGSYGTSYEEMFSEWLEKRNK